LIVTGTPSSLPTAFPLSRQRAVVVDDAEGVDLRLQRVEAIEQEPGHLDRRQLPLPVTVEQRNRRAVYDILIGAHCSIPLQPSGQFYGADFAV
jgi:hypothetical protein